MTTRKPFFTIGIPTRNRTGWLVGALESVLDQAFSDWEIVIVNDGGNMPLSPSLERVISDSRIKWVNHEVSLGRGAARQRVVQEARGDWMLWLDDDDIFTDDALQNIATALESFEGSIAAFETITFLLQGKSWRTMVQVGFDSEMFANNASDLAEAMIHGRDASNHFGNLWSKVARTDFYRKMGFAIDPDPPRSHILEDIEFMVRALKELGNIPELPLPRPAYIFRLFGPNARTERSEEPVLRLGAIKSIYDLHRDFFDTYSNDAAYEYACLRYFSGASIHMRFHQYHEAWRLRAETAVGAGGTLMEVFLAQVMRDIPPAPGGKPLDDPSTPIEMKRMTQPSIPLNRDGMRQSLVSPQKTEGRAAPRGIRARLRANIATIASPMQIVEGAIIADLPSESWSVYGIDWRQRQWVMVDVPYAVLRNSSIFAFADQYDIAGAVQRVAWGDLAPPVVGPRRPVLPLFSIGRCGATLLGRLFSAAGSDVLFKLDAFTHLGMAARLFPQDQKPRAGLEHLAGELISHLAEKTQGAGPLVLKMRGQASGVASLLGTQEGVESLFLVRGLEDWYRSSAKAFPNALNTLAPKLIANFAAINDAQSRYSNSGCDL